MHNNPFLNPKHPFSGSETPEMAYRKHLESQRRTTI